MKEMVIISGKGGTGKTSVAASLAVLAEKSVLCDCDVDAADLHLVLEPAIQKRYDFLCGHEAVIRQDTCIACNICKELCRFDAIKTEQACEGGLQYYIDPISCEGCGVCLRFCPANAIDFPECRCGEWFVSQTRCGPLVHARLGVAAENSGKLVSTIRREARNLAEMGNYKMIIVDGPPGTGCPVIASITGASQVLIVTEPTVSGEHDLDRVLSLTRHFQIPAAVCISKWDINEERTRQIEDKARKNGAMIDGRIRYDSSFTRAQILKKAVVELDTPAAEELKQIWNNLNYEEEQDRNGGN